MPVRSVTVQLRAGVEHAVLPDHRSMRTGVEYTIPFEDFQLIPGDARKRVIEVVSMNTGATARNPNVDLTLNAVAVPAGFALGDIADGAQERDRFMLIRIDAGGATAGQVLVWSNFDARVATATHSATTSDEEDFAGVALVAITANRYAWVQNDGEVDSAVITGAVAEGDPLAIAPAANGAFIVGTGETIATARADSVVGPPTAAPVLLTTKWGKPRYVRKFAKV